MNEPPSNAKYKSVRALSRGLEVLIELNRVGRARPSQIANETGIDRCTVYRLLHTLYEHSLVARSLGDDSWYLTKKVRQLSSGYIERDRLHLIALNALCRLLAIIRWPSDFAVFDSGSMLIEETTHGFSHYSVHRNMVGRRRSLFHSAMGRAMLVASSDEDRTIMINLARTVAGEEPPSPNFVDHMREDFAKRGYTWSIGESEKKISAIAMPIRANETVLGTVNIIFFRSAFTPEKMAAMHLEHLTQCVAEIEHQLKGFRAPL